MLQYAGRDRVVYGGANSGCLHAIAAKDAEDTRKERKYGVLFLHSLLLVYLQL